MGRARGARPRSFLPDQFLACRPGTGYPLGMSDVTRVLSAIQTGDPHASADLLPLVYDELRKLAAARMAAEPAGQTLQPTALVHEVYLRLVGSNPSDGWDGRGH